MNRSKVICHMMVSIDGKIDGDYMSQANSEATGNAYDSLIFQMGDSMAGGKNTALMYHAKGTVDFSKYQNMLVDHQDYVIPSPSGHYHFVYDRHGTCLWNTNTMTYGGKSMGIVEVLSKSVKPEYLLYLRDIGVRYLLVDSVKESLEKMYSLRGVQTLVLTGGALINGGFLEEDMIDVISLTVAPYIEGNAAFKGIVEGMNSFKDVSFGFKKASPLPNGGVHLLFERK